MKTETIDYPEEIKKNLQDLSKVLVAKGVIRIHDGHNIYEYSLADKVLRPFNIHIEYYDESLKHTVRMVRFKLNGNCIYIGALNFNSAKKRLLKIFKVLQDDVRNKV